MTLDRAEKNNILKKTYELAMDATGPGYVYGGIAMEEARRVHAGKKKEEPPYKSVEYDPEAMVERILALCETKDGVITKAPWECYIDEDGDVFCDMPEHESPGRCDLPDDICGKDRMIGSIHTHPTYPPDPSWNDFKLAVGEKNEAFCIAAKGDEDRRRGVCFFPDKPGDFPYAAVRSGEWDSKFCVDVQYYVNPESGFDDAQSCDDAFIEGWYNAFIAKMRDVIRDKGWDGEFCHVEERKSGDASVYCIGGDGFWELVDKDWNKIRGS